MKAKPILTIMTGLPRCGKSTWVQKHKKDAIVVCPDEIRVKIFGHQFHLDCEEFVWAFVNAMIKLLLDQGKSVMVDATSVNEFKRSSLIRIAKKYNSKTRIVWIKTSIAECKRRNEKSPRGKKVPYKVIDRMASSFEDPMEAEGADVIEVPKSKYRRVRKGNYYNLCYLEEPIKIAKE